MKKLFITLFILSIFPSGINANDTSGYVLPTGGVVFEKQDGIKMQVEALYIRPKQIEVNYLFENTTDKDITIQVFFPLPEMSESGNFRDDKGEKMLVPEVKGSIADGPITTQHLGWHLTPTKEPNTEYYVYTGNQNIEFHNTPKENQEKEQDDTQKNE